MTAHQVPHPVDLAAARVDDLDPDYVARVRAELHAGPLTRERVQTAVHALAGLGTVVEVRVLQVIEMDGAHVAGGRTATGRDVWFPLPDDDLARELREAEATGQEPWVAVPPVDLHDLPADIL